jgi:hypothetical protein
MTKTFDDEHLVVAFDSGVSVCSVLADGGTLAESLGKLDESVQPSFVATLSLDELLASLNTVSSKQEPDVMQVENTNGVADSDSTSTSTANANANAKSKPKSKSKSKPTGPPAEPTFHTIDDAAWQALESQHSKESAKEEKRIMSLLRSQARSGTGIAVSKPK